jgi:lactate/malate dehydrogenase, NAD binding domain
MSDLIRVAVTGAAGQVAYGMLARLASGEVFGPDKKVLLHLLEIPQALPALEGILMELDDCAFPNLSDVVITDDPNKAFAGVNWALLVGSASMARSSSVRAKPWPPRRRRMSVSSWSAIRATPTAWWPIAMAGRFPPSVGRR